MEIVLKIGPISKTTISLQVCEPTKSNITLRTIGKVIHLIYERITVSRKFESVSL